MYKIIPTVQSKSNPLICECREGGGSKMGSQTYFMNPVEQFSIEACITYTDATLQVFGVPCDVAFLFNLNLFILVLMFFSNPYSLASISCTFCSFGS